MNILSALLSLPVSIILVVWLVRCKKRYDPFVKGNVTRLLIAGAISAVVGFSVTLIFVAVRAVNVIGLDTLRSWFAAPDVSKILDDLQALQTEKAFSFARLFIFQLYAVGWAEELSRYAALRVSTNKQPFAKTCLDLAICGGIVGTGFTVVEDLLYSSGGAGLTLMRSLMPFHFAYGAFMGWFIGKAFTTGKKWYHLVGIAIPVLIHTLFDASISATEYESIYLLLVLLALILNAVLTVVMIVRINRLSKQAGTEKQAQV